MASRKKKPLKVQPTEKTSETDIEDALDFVTGGKADVLHPSHNVKKAGRPRLDEEISARTISLRAEDIGMLELLSAQWAIKSSSGTRLGLAPVVRSIVAAIRPALEQLKDAPESEEELRDLISELVQLKS